MLLLFACAGPTRAPSPETGSPADTAVAGDDTGTTTAGPCAEEPDPDRDLTLPGLLARLEAQGCLAEADQALLVGVVDAFFATETVWCDAVWRVSSADGRWFTGAPERVHEHGSVPDVAIGPDGAHWLAVNDLTPGRFAEVLRDDPARFWRQGFVGIGGLGLWREGEGGFAEEALDLQLPAPIIVVDPDLSWDGVARLATFTASWPELDGADPSTADLPHLFFRTSGATLGAFDPPTLVVEQPLGDGGMDPTILDVGGDEILFLGSNVTPMMGWTAPDAAWPDAGALADVVTDLLVMAPDAVEDPAGGYRIYAWDPVVSQVGLLTSDDGRAWTPQGLVVDEALGVTTNPSVVVDGSGTWWLYYSQRDGECVDAVEGADSGG